MDHFQLNRRGFLKVLGSAVAAGASQGAFGQRKLPVAIIFDRNDNVVRSQAVLGAIQTQEWELQANGIPLEHPDGLREASEASLRILIAGAQNPAAQEVLHAAQVDFPATTEAMGIVALAPPLPKTFLVCGHDSRGLVYALNEFNHQVRSRVRNAPHPVAALATIQTSVQQPTNQIRSMMRLFTSDVEDKPWFNDRAMWPEYFHLLAEQRFNRFQLAFGIGYDFIRSVTDAYFLFTYPFFLDVPGYQVRVPQLPNQERDRNLEMLKYISEQCVASGLEFHVGLWMHGYEWIDSPNPNYTIEGRIRTTTGRTAGTRFAGSSSRCPTSAASPSASTAKAAWPKAASISGRPFSMA